VKIRIDGQEFEVDPHGDTVVVDGQTYSVRLLRQGDIVTVYVNERPFAVQLPPELAEGPFQVIIDAKVYQVEMKGAPAAPRPARRGPPPKPLAAGAGVITSPLTGRIIKVLVQAGDEVKEGDLLLVIEAMKMENEIVAPRAGRVKEVAVAPGARVNEGDLLVVLEVAD